MKAIEVDGLSRWFGKFCAVDNISFTVEEGEIFGFLGANGAGKTTTIRMLCGILSPSGGRARVGGFDVERDTDELKRNIGYMSQKFSLYDDLTVGENLEFFGGIYRLARPRLVERVNWALAMAGLEGSEGRVTRTLAAGFKQRLALGCAVLHEPKVLFLDEPTAGTDPVSRERFWNMIRTMAKGGITVLVTTHYMDEAQQCSRLTLMDSGRIIAEGTPADLKQRSLVGRMYELTAGPFALVREALSSMGLPYAEPFGIKFHLIDPSGGLDKNFVAKLTALLAARNCQCERIKEVPPTLEDVFLALIGRDDRAAGGAV